MVHDTFPLNSEVRTLLHTLTPYLQDESLESGTPRTPDDKCTSQEAAAAAHTTVLYESQSRRVQAWFVV